MARGFVASHVVRGNRNLLIVGVLVSLAGAFSLRAVQGSHWTHFLFPAAIAATGAIMVGLGIVRSFSPSLHPIYRRLAAAGDARTLAAALDREFATAPLPAFGREWLVSASFYGLDATRWTDIAWVYVQVTRRHGSEMYRKVFVWSRDGDLLETPPTTTPAEADRQLSDVAARAPWAEVGYSAEREKEWRRRRPDVVRRVDARQVAKGAPLAGSPPT
jgi:hypothetical protein